MELQLRRTAAPDYLDAAPEHSARMAGAERLHRRLLRGKPGGERRIRVAASATVGNLSFCEHPQDESFPVPFDRLADTGNLGRVDAGAEDLHLLVGTQWFVVGVN